jgi:hypothetical protein
VICGKKITHYINRTEYPSGLVKKSGLRRILFESKPGLWRVFFMTKSSSSSFWDAIDLKFLILFTSLIVKMIQEKHSREALVLT